MFKTIIMHIRMYINDYLVKRRTNKLIARIILDDRVPSADCIDPKRFK